MSVAQAPKPPHDVAAAWLQTQVFVKQYLRSPGTANFGSPGNDYQAPEKVVQHLGDGKYIAKGWVDSQDGFGKIERSFFEVTLHYDPGVEGQWVLDRREFLNQ